MKYATIERNRNRYSIQMMCRLLHVSRSGFYAAKTRPESARCKQDRKLIKEIRRVHTQSKGVYGSPKIQAELVDEGSVREVRHKLEILSLIRTGRFRANSRQASVQKGLVKTTKT